MSEKKLIRLKDYLKKNKIMGRAGSNWNTIHQKILELNRPVTSKEVSDLAGCKHLNEARAWLERQVTKNKYLTYPEREYDNDKNLIRRTGVVYSPIDAPFLNEEE